MRRALDFLVIYPFFNIQFSWGKCIIRKWFSHVFPWQEWCLPALFFCWLFGFVCLFVWCLFFFCFLLFSTGIPIARGDICKNRGWLMSILQIVKLMEKVWVVIRVLQGVLRVFFLILLVICTHVIFLLRSASKFLFEKLFPKSVSFDCPT